MGNEYFHRWNRCFAVLIAFISCASFAYSNKYTIGIDVFSSLEALI